MARSSPARGLTWNTLNDIEAFRRVTAPLLNFSECESSAFVRAAISHAQSKDLVEVSPFVDLLPTSVQLGLGVKIGRCPNPPEHLSTTEDRNKAATNAAKSLVSARTWFDHAKTTVDTAVRPTMYYYGALSFYKFITFCLVRTATGKGAHGLSLSCASDGHDFSKSWPRQSCRITIEDAGDFPFFVDVLTAAGWPSLLGVPIMSKRHHAQPGQLSLWGVYELEAQAVAAYSRPAQRPAVVPVAEGKPIFKAPITMIVFRAPDTQNGPSTSALSAEVEGPFVINSQAVARPSRVQKRSDVTGLNGSKPAAQSVFRSSVFLVTSVRTHFA